MIYNILLLLISLYSLSGAAIFKVAKYKAQYGAQFSTIQDAVNACKISDDNSNTIIVMDDEEYIEKVTIDSMSNIVLTSRAYLENSQSLFQDYRKLSLPTIRWTDIKNVRPTTQSEAGDETISGEFQRNGAISVIASNNITISGFNIRGDSEDGVGAGGAGWQKDGVWGGQYPVVHGNTGIAIYVSGNVKVNNCKIFNCYFGIYALGRNISGVYTLTNQFDNDVSDQIPLSNLGKVGNYLIEKNEIFDNSFAIGLESEWGLGSTFRYNMVYSNYYRSQNPSRLFPNTYSSFKLPSDNNYAKGGVFQIKDATLAEWKVYNNTFYDNLSYFNSYWRGGKNYLIANNIFASPHQINSDVFDAYELITQFTNFYSNLLTVHKEYPELQPDFSSYYVAIFNNMELEKVGGKTLPDAKIIKNSNISIESKDNRWITFKSRNNNDYRDKIFESTTRTDSNFLVMNYQDANNLSTLVTDKSYLDIGIYDRDNTNGDIGALVRLQDNDKIDWVGQYSGPELHILDGTFAMLENGKVKINFGLIVENGIIDDIDLSSLTYKRVEYYSDLPYLELGDNNKVSSSIYQDPTILDVGSLTPKIGGNTLELSGISNPGDFASFHILISYKDKNGNQRNSNIGIFPFRKTVESAGTSYNKIYLDVTFDKTTIEVGESVMMSVVARSPFSCDGENLLLKTVSGDIIYKGDNSDKITNWETNFVDLGTKEITFHQTGVKMVIVSGSDGSNVALGISTPITVTSSKPNNVRFYDPPSSKINPNIITPIIVNTKKECVAKVFDRFGNQLNEVGDTLEATVTIDDTSLFKLDTNIDIFKISKDGTLKFPIKSVGIYDEQTLKRTKIHIKLLGTDGEEDYAKLMLGRTNELLFAKSNKTNMNINDTAKVTLFRSITGKDTIKTVNGFSLLKNSYNSSIKFYWDKNGVYPVKTDTIYHFYNDTTYYITSNIPQVITYSLKEEQNLGTSIDKIKIDLPPLTKLYFTWSKDSTDTANTVRAFSVSQDSITLYAWGVSELGTYLVNVDWQGSEIFDGLKFSDTNCISINITPELIGKGKFSMYYAKDNLTSTSPYIYILDRVDDVLLIDSHDYDTTLNIKQLQAIDLSRDSTIYLKLSDSIAIFSIAIDTVKNRAFKLNTDWIISKNNDTIYNSNSQNYFSKKFDINELNYVGTSTLFSTYIAVDTIIKPPIKKSCKLVIRDPVNKIWAYLPTNVSENNMFKINNIINNNDTVNIDINFLYYNQNRLAIQTHYIDSISNKDYLITTKWKIESIKLKDKTYKYALDTFVTNQNIVTKETNLIKITVSRNGITFSFYANIINLIRVGIFPNPVPASRFGTKNSPIIKVVVNGTVTSLNAMIFDRSGNVVKLLSGIDENGDFKEQISDTTTSHSDSDIGKVQTFICNSWDGKNIFNNYVSSGNYVLYFKIKYIDKDKNSNTMIEKIPFYIIGKKR